MANVIYPIGTVFVWNDTLPFINTYPSPDRVDFLSDATHYEMFSSEIIDGDGTYSGLVYKAYGGNVKYDVVYDPNGDVLGAPGWKNQECRTMVATAEWSLTEQYNIEMLANGTFTVPSTFALTYYYKDQVLKAEEVTELPTPLPIPTLDVENSEFVGWYYDENYTQEANEGDTIAEDTAIFAKFEVKRLVKISDQDDLDKYEQKPTTETITEPYAIVVAVPNKIFNCTSVSGLSTLEIDDSTATSNEECLIYFTSGATATTLIYDDSVTKWIGGVPTIEANKQYVISIVKNLAVIGGA